MKNIKLLYNEILHDLKKHGKKDQIDTFKMAYKVSSSDKEMAYSFGLWNNWIEKTDWSLGQIVNDNMEEMRYYFKEKEVGKFFDLETKIIHKRRPIYKKILLILAGFYCIVLGVIRQRIGMNEVFINLKMQQPRIVGGLSAILGGVLILALAYSIIWFEIEQKRFYERLSK